MTNDDFVKTYLRSQLSGLSNDKFNKVYDDKVKDNKLLLENPPRKVNNRRKKPSKSKFKRKEINLSLSKELNYKELIKINRLWNDYINELINDDIQSIPNKLLKADLNGSILQVVSSSNPSLIGIQGLNLLETKNSFKILTEQNKVKVIPKFNSKFKLFSDRFNINFYGKNLILNPLDKFNKKFKHKLV